MGSLQTELVRVGLADSEKYRFNMNLQLAAPELQQALRRLKTLEGKFPLMDKTTKLLLAVEYADANTLEQKVVSINNTCDYLEKL